MPNEIALTNREALAAALAESIKARLGEFNPVFAAITPPDLADALLAHDGPEGVPVMTGALRANVGQAEDIIWASITYVEDEQGESDPENLCRYLERFARGGEGR